MEKFINKKILYAGSVMFIMVKIDTVTRVQTWMELFAFNITQITYIYVDLIFFLKMQLVVPIARIP